MDWNNLFVLFIKLIVAAMYVQEIILRVVNYVLGTQMYMVMMFAFEYTEIMRNIKKWFKG